MEIFHIDNLSFTYPLKDTKALSNINLSINEGEFVVLCGCSGCGKTTLLKHFKPVLSPHGVKQGIIKYRNDVIENINEIEIVSKIGYVSQIPDNQIVTDKVWHELAFAMESLGIDTHTIRIRVAEMASFFGIQSWFYKSVTQLSGGQKQLLNLAAVMTLKPDVLILDEPLSQLDPIACTDFLNMLKKINDELGVTVIMSEHRLEECIPLCDRLIVMDKGNIISDKTPQEACKILKKNNHPMFYAMTSPMKIYSNVINGNYCPITVKEGRHWVDNYLKGKNTSFDKVLNPTKNNNKTIIKFKEVWFKYSKKQNDIIKNLSFEVKKGEFFAIVGGNGTGKTTTLALVSNIYKPYRGKIYIDGDSIKKSNLKTVLLPQDPTTLFTKKTVREELYNDISDNEKVCKVIELIDLENLLDMHPFDLSGGERQRVALAKILLLEPDILLLDEPTKGIDEFFKINLAKILKKLTSKGVTIIMVSHDIEFCAKYTDRCGLFFDGQIISCKYTKDFFIDNSFYTTVSNRMVGHLCKNIVTEDEVIRLCKSI